MVDMKALKAAEREAEAFLSNLKGEREAARRAATAKVDEEFQVRMSDAEDARRNATSEVRDAIEAAASHPLDGKRVFIDCTEATSRWSRTTKIVRYEGIVEVVRRASDFPSNMTGTRPKLGDVIVRKIKKDGSASLQFYDKYGRFAIDNWKLAE